MVTSVECSVHRSGVHPDQLDWWQIVLYHPSCVYRLCLTSIVCGYTCPSVLMVTCPWISSSQPHQNACMCPVCKSLFKMDAYIIFATCPPPPKMFGWELLFNWHLPQYELLQNCCFLSVTCELSCLHVGFRLPSNSCLQYHAKNMNVCLVYPLTSVCSERWWQTSNPLTGKHMERWCIAHCCLTSITCG